MIEFEVSIPHVGPTDAKVTNDVGGEQSPLPYRFDLIDAKAMFVLAGVLALGAEKYGEDNWRKLSTKEHLNRVLCHVYAYLAGDRQDDHLGHALCRAMMALAVCDEINARRL